MTRTHLLRGFYGTGVNSEEGDTDSVNIEEALIAKNDVAAFTTKLMATMTGWTGIGKKTMQGILRHITLKEANRLAKADSKYTSRAWTSWRVSESPQCGPRRWIFIPGRRKRHRSPRRR